MVELDRATIPSLARAFMESRVLLTAVELDLFSLMGDGRLTSKQLAELGGWDQRGLEILLDALVVTGLARKQRGAYSNTSVSRECLCNDSEASLLPMVRHHAQLWDSWSQLSDRVRANGKAEPHDQLRAFIGAMDWVAAPLAPGIVAAVGAPRGGRVLDLGGGSGAYTAAFLSRDRSVRMTLFDRPDVVVLAREFLAQQGCEKDVQFVGGDFLRDDLPPDQDLVFLSAIVHSLSLEQCALLFSKAFEALVPGGRLVIRDHVMSDDRLQPRAGAIFSVNMLAATEGGRTYTYTELRTRLEESGFIDVRLAQDGERMNALVEATKPGT